MNPAQTEPTVQATHTPAPWRVVSNEEDGYAPQSSKLGIESAVLPHYTVAVVISDCVVEHEANACLIAAAPQLLAALITARNLLNSCGFDPEATAKITSAIAAATKGAP